MVKQSLETDDSPQSPLLHRTHHMSLRKNRAGNDVHVPINGDDEGPSTSYEDINFVYNHTRYNVRLDSTGITLVPHKPQRFRLWKYRQMHIPFGNVLSVDMMEKLPWRTRVRQWLQRRKSSLALAVYAAERSSSNPNQQHCKRLILLAEDPAVARGWALEVNSAVWSSATARPSRVLVFVNPKSGSGKAAKVWAFKAQPLLQYAGVECLTVFTGYAGHAVQHIEELSLEELESFDGALAVGGDGIFKEVLEGVLNVKARGGREAIAAESWRLGQVPAGSTDAVAWTLHGTRSPQTAALDVALGASGCLDVMRVDSGDGKCSYSVCYAAYGYMGDLMRQSERMRWLGAFRYTLSGVITFLMAKSYSAHISYVPSQSLRGSTEQDSQCISGCDQCASGVISAGAHDQFSLPARQAFKAEPFREVQGEFRSVMVVVSPCRSDMSPLGLSPHSHLSDGRIRLILVRKCSQLQYLRFMASIPRKGITRGQFDFVDILDVSAVRVVPQGSQSVWNVDGELLKNNFIDTQIHRGLIRVFSSGPQW